ncbi:MAG: lactate racemase domain-containing protein [Treponema sp.]|jgi:nickel-dependent lactate racemase|nr:lactate racemase domain-containing protein [Treponema sp.]
MDPLNTDASPSPGAAACGKTYIARGAADLALSPADLDALFSEALRRVLADLGPGGPVLILPPDLTRMHSQAGFLTDVAVRELSRPEAGAYRPGAVMPALGTHRPMTAAEIRRMFPRTPPERFIPHDWRRDVCDLGRLEADWVGHISQGAVRYDWPVQVNRRLCAGTSGGCALIISIGQVVPHEVAGMANHAKNVFVGTGGKEAIDKSHYLGAVFGLERIMGRTDTPVRALFDEGMRRFGSLLPPVLWVLTVVDGTGGRPVVRGLYAGFGRSCFEEAAALARRVNVTLLDEPVSKMVVYLDPEEFRTTWLGNKAIYRTRMAIAGGGELLILAPGLEGFGEDPSLDRLIRRHGYRPGGVIRRRAAEDRELAESLSAAAHLIHGSPEGRFTVRYCPGPGLGAADLEAAGYAWGSLEKALDRYNPRALKPGVNILPGGERIFFVSNPALGLWAERKRFEASQL